MGDMRGYSCKCGYEEELWIGCGFMAKDPDTVKRCIPEDGYSPFYEAYSEGKVPDFLLSMAIARCGSCKRIVSVNALSYTLPPEISNSPEAAPREARYIGACPRCGGEVNEEKDIERIRCPKCGGKMFYRIIGKWD